MPTYTYRPRPRTQTIDPELKLIRRLIRFTNIALRRGDIDTLQATRTIARLSEALAKLIRIEHAINPPMSAQDEAHEIIERLCRLWPDKEPLPDLDPSHEIEVPGWHTITPK